MSHRSSNEALSLPRGLLILGFGGHARAVADVALSMGVSHLAFEQEGAREDEHFQGFKVYPYWEGGVPNSWAVFCAAGDGAEREKQCTRVIEAGWSLATLISPRASLGVGCHISPGCFVGHQAHIGPMARMGMGCIINSGAVVEHETELKDFVHVSVNATVAGRCKIGRQVWLGAGSIIIDKVVIGEHVVVGAGAVVIADLPESGTYVGVPAVRLSG